MANNELKQTNHRAFIDKNGGYQSERTGSDKEAHDAWVKSNSWGLTRDDFIRLSYFHGDMEAGSDGTGPINGSEDRPGDVVYISQDGGAMTRSMVSYWFADSNSFMHGYKKALEAHTAQAEPSDAAPGMPQPAFSTPFLKEMFWVTKGDYYTADQMRAYAKQAIEATRGVALSDAACALRGGKCSCPTSCERNMQTAMRSSGQVIHVANAASGWPVEPTLEMQHAGASAICFDTTIINKLWTANAVYRAMRTAIQAQAGDAPTGGGNV